MFNMIDKLFQAAWPKDAPAVKPDQTPEQVLASELDTLASIQDEADRISKPFRDQIAMLEQAQKTALGILEPRIEAQERRCKDMCIAIGRNVFAGVLKAEYVSASKTVDVKGLMGYALEHPGVSTFISDGKPSCRIKTISAKERKALDLVSLN